MCQEIVFSWFDGQTRYALIDQAPWDFIKSNAQFRSNSNEAGGILLGYRAGTNIHIISATGPLPRDRRSRVSFDRLDPGHQVTASEAWATSGGRIDYIGDWHTHPQSVPTPSSKDYLEWKKLTASMQAPHLLVIVGTREVRVWLSSELNSKILPAFRT
ncbi:Mov34/MPN/PAD-1 family protein [Pseudomonas xanthosomatis]|uniref:Mov34/MPN/PAD-1 family protein n=1 Tax=Pseudomonas xanthosomatis TaxID=2842356 RepID=UPI001C3CC913|nr:Mov34/MPN/PAD-1 family protein [Pseudomonas xanthosomatis]